VNDGKDYKNYATQLKKILTALDQVKAKPREFNVQHKSNKMHVIKIDLRNKNQFVAVHQNELNHLANRFKSYIKNNPKSIWTDDAAFCLAMLYLSTSFPGNENYILAIEQTKYFLTKFPEIRIEDWTKNKFKRLNSFELVLSKKLLPHDSPLAKSSEEKRIKGLLTRSIIYEYLKANKILEAERELAVLRKTKSNEILFGLEDDIKSYKEMKGQERESADVDY
jgi:hypothetical protein